MTRPSTLRTAWLLAALPLVLVAAQPCGAASSTSSAVSDSASTSVGSVSNSLQRSSDSSSKKDVAQGDYRIIDIAAAPGQTAHVRLRLRALAAEGPADDFFLLLPQAVAEQSRLAPGHVVSARQRGYGMAFSLADGHDAFFLVLADDVYRELQTHKVVAL